MCKCMDKLCAIHAQRLFKQNLISKFGTVLIKNAVKYFSVINVSKMMFYSKMEWEKELPHKF